jgi:LysM repeat protein
LAVVSEKGDSLTKISLNKLGNASRYKEIMKLNNLKNSVLDIGQKLKLPNK